MSSRLIFLSLLSSVVCLHLSPIVLLPFLTQLTLYHRHPLLSAPASSLSSTDVPTFLFNLPPLLCSPSLCVTLTSWAPRLQLRHPKQGPSALNALILSQILCLFPPTVPWWSSWQFLLTVTQASPSDASLMYSLMRSLPARLSPTYPKTLSFLPLTMILPRVSPGHYVHILAKMSLTALLCSSLSTDLTLIWVTVF